MRLNIKEIAEEANVSAGTVDRVLHNRGSVNPEKRKRIEEILRECDYRPNLYARNLRLNKEIVVGYLTPLLSSEDGYWELVYKGVLNAQRDLRDYTFRVEKFEYDRNKVGSFSIQGEKMINAGITCCAMVAKCVEEAQTFLSEHQELTYVFIDSIVPGTNAITTIGQDPFKGGYLAGRLMHLMHPDGDTILTFSFKNSHISNQRIGGFLDFCERNTDWHVIRENLESTDDIHSLLESVLQDMNHIGGIFCPCFAGHFVSRELDSLGIKRRIRVITYDLNGPNRKALENGELDCILSQRPVCQGYAGIYQLYRHLVLEQDLEKSLEVQIDVLFAENLPEEFDENCIGQLNQYCIPVR